jgi:hypothetical protein
MWDYTGMKVFGEYMNEFLVTGRVESSRVAYGGDVKHTVVLDDPIIIYGSVRDRVILEHKQIVQVRD